MTAAFFSCFLWQMVENIYISLFYTENEMKIAIVSENRFEQKTLDEYISSWALKNITCVNTMFFGSEEKFSMRAQTQDFDIVFMDITINGQNSFETARNLRKFNINTPLIIIAENSKYMTQAFSLHAFEYIIKPYDEKRIAQVLDDAILLLGNVDKVTELADKLTRYQSFMIVSRGAVVIFDNTMEIADSYCVINNGDRVPVSRRKSKEVEQRYTDRQFIKTLSKV